MSSTEASMDPREQLREILPLLKGLVADLGPGELDAPTPCARYAVRDILAHMVGGATMFAAAFRGEEVAPAGDADLHADVLVAFPAAMDDLQAGVTAPGALDRTIESPFGPMPGEAFARLVAMDGLVHGWDLATATGKRYEPSGAVVEAVDGFTRQALTPDLRDGDTFALAVDPPAGASALVKLVAFTGRPV